MSSIIGSIPVERSFRFREMRVGEEIHRIMFVLHGYGQLAEFFIRKFDTPELSNTLVIAPEGMHRFYLQGSSGRVGASWMTKEWREQDISDNVNALNNLYHHVADRYPGIPVTVLGFSQGGATAARWVVAETVPCTHFISWASVFPPDVDPDVLHGISMKRSFCLGKDDPYFNEHEAQKTIDFYKSLNFEIHTFEGKHDIEPSVLAKLLDHE
jgi:predicted esterase